MSGPASSSYVDAAVDVVMKIHSKEEDGHILVFLTGQDEIEKACAMIRSRAQDQQSSVAHDHPDAYQLVVLPLYASLPTEAQRLVFKKLESPFDESKTKASGGDSRGKWGGGSTGIAPAADTSASGSPKKSSGRLRKCVVATNIAETSITVPNVR